MTMLKPSEQKPWYELICKYIKGYTVVDVGAGNGFGVEMMLAAGASSVIGIDIKPRGCKGHVEVLKMRGEDLPINSYDWATCLDVLEHSPTIEKANELFKHLLKVAKVGVFITTPNFNTYKADNSNHPFEYMPEELEELLTGLDYEMWNDNKSYPPFRVDSLHKCQNFGVIIRNHRNKR